MKRNEKKVNHNISRWLRAVYSNSVKSVYGHLYDGIAQLCEASQNTILKRYLFF